MIHPTNHPAFLLRETSDGFTPILYPFKRKDGTWIEIKSCVNRSAIHAYKCGLRWLDKEDLICRRELGDWIHPIPDLESGPLSQMDDALFSENQGDVYA